MACKETWHNSLRYGKKTHQGFTTFQELHLLIYQRHQTEPGCNAAFQFPWPHHKNRAFKSSAFAPESAMPSLQFLRATQNSPFDPRTVQRPLLCWPGRRRSTPKRSLAAPSSAGMDAARCRPAPSFGSWPLGATLVPPKRLGRLGASGGAVATAAARAICCRANQRRLVLKWFVAFTARSRLISLGAAARLDLLETNDPPLSAASCSAENRVLGCSQGAPAKGGGFPSTFELGDSTKATTLLALGCAGTVQDSFKPVVNSPCFSHPADLSPGAGTKVGGGKHPAVSCSHCCPRDLTSSKGWRQQLQTAIPSVGCSKTSRYISLWCHTRALSYRYYTREMKDFFLLFLSSWNACTPLFLLLLAISHTHTTNAGCLKLRSGSCYSSRGVPNLIL